MGLAVWERTPEETNKSFAAFMIYLRFPVGERSLQKVSDALGHANNNTVQRWGTKYNWAERVAAYENHRANTSLVLVETTLDGAISDHIQKMTTIYAKAEQIVMEMISDIDIRFHTPDDKGRPQASLVELQRAVRVAEQIDTAKRRVLGLPTAYLHERSDKEISDEEVFYIGQGKPKTDDDEE